MKNLVLIFFLASFQLLLCQEKIVQKRTMNADELEITTFGLDDIVIENSEDNTLEVILFDENPYTHNILLNEENGVLKVEFELNFLPLEEQVFRKYITKRLERARAIIKVPKHKKVLLHGKTIGVTSKSYEGELSIYIDKGNVQLNNVMNSATVHLFLGNVYARVFNAELNLTTKKGSIVVDGESKESPFNKHVEATSKKLTINSIHANISIVTH